MMISYRILKSNEKQSLASIHLDAFHGFFLSSLGERFLNTYYNAALKSDETIAVCAIDENEQILGFGTGCVRSNGYHKRIIMQNLLTFLPQGLIILFTNPKAFLRLIKSLNRIAIKNDDQNYAELISIGITQTNQGLGIGKNLVRTFEEEAKRRGCKKITLTTDYYDNEDVVTFYQNSGYKVFYEFNAYPERKMYKYIKDLNL